MALPDNCPGAAGHAGAFSAGRRQPIENNFLCMKWFCKRLKKLAAWAAS